jgi:hypothetical protein
MFEKFIEVSKKKYQSSATTRYLRREGGEHQVIE